MKRCGKKLNAHVNMHGLEFQKETLTKGIDGCVDVVGIDGKNRERELIEIDLRRYGPVGNVIKIWRRLCRDMYRHPVLFIQAFSGLYDEKVRAKDHATFIARKMRREFKNVRYVSLNFGYKPAARKANAPVMKGGGRRKGHAEQLAERILAKLPTHNRNQHS